MHHQTSRRKFLQYAAAMAAVPASRSLAAVSPSDKLSVAFIGCGGIARHHVQHLPPQFVVNSVADVDQGRLEAFVREFAPGAHTTDDYRDAIARPEVDAVFVCTPDHWHAAIALFALSAGKDVYCEKPLTLTIAEGQILADAVAKSERVFQVGTQQRSDPNFQTAVALAHAGRVGRLRRVTAAIGSGPAGGPFSTETPPPGLNWERWLGPAPNTEYRPQRCHGNFRWWYEYSGGKMTDWGAHHVDIAQWAIADGDTHPISIEVLHAEHGCPLKNGAPVRPDSFNTATTFHLRCRFSDGAELDIRDSAPELGFENGLLFEGEEGRFFVNRGKLAGKPVEQLKTSPIDERQLAALRKGRGVAAHYLNFYQSCLDRGETISDVASHVRHLNTCHAANIAMRLGRSVVWRPAEARFDDPSLDRWISRPRRDGYELTGS